MDSRFCAHRQLLLMAIAHIYINIDTRLVYILIKAEQCQTRLPNWLASSTHRQIASCRRRRLVHKSNIDIYICNPQFWTWFHRFSFFFFLFIRVPCSLHLANSDSFVIVEMVSIIDRPIIRWLACTCDKSICIGRCIRTLPDILYIIWSFETIIGGGKRLIYYTHTHTNHFNRPITILVENGHCNMQTSWITILFGL